MYTCMFSIIAYRPLGTFLLHFLGHPFAIMVQKATAYFATLNLRRPILVDSSLKIHLDRLLS